MLLTPYAAPPECRSEDPQKLGAWPSLGTSKPDSLACFSSSREMTFSFLPSSETPSTVGFLGSLYVGGSPLTQFETIAINTMEAIPKLLTVTFFCQFRIKRHSQDGALQGWQSYRLIQTLPDVSLWVLLKHLNQKLDLTQLTEKRLKLTKALSKPTLKTLRTGTLNDDKSPRYLPPMETYPTH